mmetsp:Transcript_34043/g.75487  ORF Transcript_34043/g.75487 Transcript_34043/m.75487 type:complete len:288 (-) Transcript_34043:718-1581(-)
MVSSLAVCPLLPALPLLRSSMPPVLLITAPPGEVSMTMPPTPVPVHVAAELLMSTPAATFCGTPERSRSRISRSRSRCAAILLERGTLPLPPAAALCSCSCAAEGSEAGGWLPASSCCWWAWWPAACNAASEPCANWEEGVAGRLREFWPPYWANDRPVATLGKACISVLGGALPSAVLTRALRSARVVEAPLPLLPLWPFLVAELPLPFLLSLLPLPFPSPACGFASTLLVPLPSLLPLLPLPLLPCPLPLECPLPLPSGALPSLDVGSSSSSHLVSSLLSLELGS